MKERGLEIFVPEEESPDKDSEVFFNDKMKTNRDLSEIAVKVFKKRAGLEKLRAADALAASGIRGFRIEDTATDLHLNDANPQATEAIRKGLEKNSLTASVHEEDANVFLSRYRNYFNFIDIDPFGSFSKFLDSTARAANHQSFVGLTATDNAAPAGSYPTVCRRRYSSRPLKNQFMHETGLRIYIKEVFQNFARFDKCFDPKICFHERHYSRVMGRVTESKKRTNKALDNIGYLSYCSNCLWRKFERREHCPNCGEKVDVAGPLWTGKFVDQRFTSDMLEEMPENWESREMLERLDSEAEILTPFYGVHSLSSNTGEQAPKRGKLIQEIEEKGYPVSRTHFSPTGIRTEAPVKDIKEIIQNLNA
ncbi:MAG: tRNA (guanine(10)-N(2))-dimethyltransferase [Candidatus Nanohalobium sp.]